MFAAEELAYGLDSLASRFPKVLFLVRAGIGTSAGVSLNASGRAVIQPPQSPRSARINWSELVRSKRRVALALSRIVAFYRATLDTEVGVEARKYLTERGIGSNTVLGFQIRYGGPPDA